MRGNDHSRGRERRSAIARVMISDYSQHMRRALQTVRAFNRALTRRWHAASGTGPRAGREQGADRVLLAVGPRGSPERLLRERLALDSGDLSRLLRALKRQGLLRSEAHSGEDARRRFIVLTRAGLARVRRLDAQEQARVRSLLAPLSASESRQLLEAMVLIERLLSRSAVVIEPEDPAGAAARWCFARYFDELDARFPGGFDRRAGGGTVRAELRPPRGRLLIARLDGTPVGCGAIRELSPGVLEIKRMWVAPGARGLGIGRHLLEALERIARRRRARLIRLDTHATLNEALRLYRKAGYRRIARYNDNPYAQRWFEKRLR
jgi:ribosomal protein S18 acetylase RimI-like enzyme